MAIINSFPAPIEDAIAAPKRPEYKGTLDPQEGKLTKSWIHYFTALQDLMAKSAGRVAAVSVAGISGTVAATDFTGGLLTAGLYRINFYAYMTVAAATGTYDITFDWTTAGVPRTSEKFSLDATTTAGVLYEPPLFIRVDAGSPVRYEVTDSTTTPPTGVFTLDIVLEEVMA